MGSNVDEQTPEHFWESRYADTNADTGRVWSGRVNQVLADVASELPPGTALDLGCGEGGDAIWLALRGWSVTAVDISSTAIDRARESAARAGVADGRIRWQARDLASWDDPARYDLVSASFFHSPVELPRPEILSRAAGLVDRGGRMLILSHGAFPPWARDHDGHELPDHRFLTPDEEVDQLGLDAGDWDVEVAEARPRDATGPDGQHAVLDDVVVLLRRH